MPDKPRLTALDGPPGSGKTTKLVKDCESWPEPWCIVTFGNDAANTLAARGVPPENAKTLYKMTWPHVREVSNLKLSRGKKTKPSYRRRNIESQTDDALGQYTKDAPSLKKRNQRAEFLHLWEPTQGDPPDWIWQDDVSREESFAVGLARWLAVGAPLKDFDGYEFMAVDEAQDVSALELAACLALVKPGGKVLAVGDPGQAIFLGGKGWPADRLPPAWERAESTETLAQGFRIGYPAADAAAGILKPFYDRSADTFRANHLTQMHPWNQQPPKQGLIMGLSRYSVDAYIKRHDLRNVGIVPELNPEGLTICTIHAAKGYETDDVYLLPWGNNRTFALDAGAPDELRLMYVALTRARRNLYLPHNLLVKANHAISRARS